MPRRKADRKQDQTAEYGYEETIGHRNMRGYNRTCDIHVDLRVAGMTRFDDLRKGYRLSRNTDYRCRSQFSICLQQLGVTHLYHRRSSSKQIYLSSQTCLGEAAAIIILRAQNQRQPGTIDGVNSYLACIRPEIDLHWAEAAQALGNEGNPLCAQKPADKGSIQFPDSR